VTQTLALTGVRAILLDIEGTVAPVSFVYDTLFPYARAHLRTFLTDAWATAEVESAVAALAAEYRAEETRPGLVFSAKQDTASAIEPSGYSDDFAKKTSPGLVSVTATADYAAWLMDRDRKSPGLKTLQGLIWARGYERGELRGELFPDVAPAMARWRAAGLRIAIYSSGSVLAQQLIFRTSADGDLTPLISDFFDTAVGAKVSAASYQAIATAMELAPAGILFVSDVTPELIAARNAGLQVTLAVRPGNAPAERLPGVAAIVSLESIA
jgi:enolase-phosphatase E1